MEKGADSRVSREKLVMSTGQRLPNPTQSLPSEAWARGRPVSALRSDVLRDPLRGRPRAVLSDDSGEVREASPPSLTWPGGCTESMGTFLPGRPGPGGVTSRLLRTAFLVGILRLWQWGNWVGVGAEVVMVEAWRTRARKVGEQTSRGKTQDVA